MSGQPPASRGGYVAAVVAGVSLVVATQAPVPGLTSLGLALAAAWLMAQHTEGQRLGALVLLELSVAVAGAASTPAAGVALWLFPVVALIPATLTAPSAQAAAAGGAVAAFLGSELLSAAPPEDGTIRLAFLHLLSVGGALYTTYQVVDAQRPANR